MPRANPDFILNMPIYMPPFEEQIRIASFLNQKSFEIDKIIVAKNNFINRLNILKKSLIYEYVTGKKEVK
jgi:type I restriction enzyme S subunit